MRFITTEPAKTRTPVNTSPVATISPVLGKNTLRSPLMSPFEAGLLEVAVVPERFGLVVDLGSSVEVTVVLGYSVEVIVVLGSWVEVTVVLGS